MDVFVEETDRLLADLWEHGCILKNPILTMSLQISLAVIPEMAITNRGLLDIINNRFIPVDISHILGNLITVIFDYQILRKPLKILSL